MSEVNGARRSAIGARRSDESFEEYERELRTALSITPSPAFEARVRQRIEEGAAHRRFSWTPAFGWLAAAASLVIVVGVVYLLQRGSPDDSMQAPRMAEHRPDVKLPAQPPPAIADVTAVREPTVAAARTPRRPARPKEPDVIVVNQMDAVRRLVAAVADGRLAVPEAPEGRVEPPVEMVIAPLVVKPMPVPTTDPDPVPPLPEIRKTQSRSTL